MVTARPATLVLYEEPLSPAAWLFLSAPTPPEPIAIVSSSVAEAFGPIAMERTPSDFASKPIETEEC